MKSLENINLLEPLNLLHWMNLDLCLWLKAVNSLRGYTYYDLTYYKNHIPLISRDVSGGYPWETGKGRGLTLNTNHFKSNLVTVPNMPTGSAARTVMFWYKQEIENVNAEILQIGGINSPGERFSPFINGSNFYIESVGASARMEHVPDSSWHMFAASQNGTRVFNIQLYLDGVPKATSYSNGTQLIIPNKQFAIANLVSYGYDFYGLLDDIRIYSRALSAAEIRAIYDDSASMFYESINRIEIVPYTPQSTVLTISDLVTATDSLNLGFETSINDSVTGEDVLINTVSRLSILDDSVTGNDTFAGTRKENGPSPYLEYLGGTPTTVPMLAVGIATTSNVSKLNTVTNKTNTLKTIYVSPFEWPEAEVSYLVVPSDYIIYISIGAGSTPITETFGKVTWHGFDLPIINGVAKAVGIYTDYVVISSADGYFLDLFDNNDDYVVSNSRLTVKELTKGERLPDLYWLKESGDEVTGSMTYYKLYNTTNVVMLDESRGQDISDARTSSDSLLILVEKSSTPSGYVTRSSTVADSISASNVSNAHFGLEAQSEFFWETKVVDQTIADSTTAITNDSNNTTSPLSLSDTATPTEIFDASKYTNLHLPFYLNTGTLSPLVDVSLTNTFSVGVSGNSVTELLFSRDSNTIYFENSIVLADLTSFVEIVSTGTTLQLWVDNGLRVEIPFVVNFAALDTSKFYYFAPTRLGVGEVVEFTPLQIGINTYQLSAPTMITWSDDAATVNGFFIPARPDNFHLTSEEIIVLSISSPVFHYWQALSVDVTLTLSDTVTASDLLAVAKDVMFSTTQMASDFLTIRSNNDFLDDTVTGVDSFLATSLRTLVITDTINALDLLRLAKDVSIIDSTTAEDTLTTSRGSAQLLTDVVAAIDFFSFDTDKSIFDNVLASDSFLAFPLQDQALTELINYTDLFVSTIKQAMYINDRVTGTDQFSSTVETIISVLDTLSPIDSFYAAARINQTLSDTVTAIDTYTTLVTQYENHISENIFTGDLWTATTAKIVGICVSVLAQDRFIVPVDRAINDSVSTTDYWLTTAISDLVTASDSWVSNMLTSLCGDYIPDKLIKDSVKAVDSFTVKNTGLTNTLSDSVTPFDIFIRINT